MLEMKQAFLDLIFGIPQPNKWDDDDKISCLKECQYLEFHVKSFKLIDSSSRAVKL